MQALWLLAAIQKCDYGRNFIPAAIASVRIISMFRHWMYPLSSIYISLCFCSRSLPRLFFSISVAPSHMLGFSVELTLSYNPPASHPLPPLSFSSNLPHPLRFLHLSYFSFLHFSTLDISRPHSSGRVIRLCPDASPSLLSLHRSPLRLSSFPWPPLASPRLPSSIMGYQYQYHLQPNSFSHPIPSDSSFALIINSAYGTSVIKKLHAIFISFYIEIINHLNVLSHPFFPPLFFFFFILR